MQPDLFVNKPDTSIPKDECFDSTIHLMTEGYLFIPNRIRKYNSQIFQTRLVGQKVICMSGSKAAEIFYDQNKFTREGAIPKRIQETLFGKKAIQTLDGAAHMHRKLLFMSIMTSENIDKIKIIARKQWQMSTRHWDRRKQVILFDEASKILFQIACKWAGVPLKKSTIKQKSEDMSAMIDAFGAVGPRHLIGKAARNRSERWAETIIKDVRSGKIIAPADSSLFLVAWHKDLSKKLLTPRMAAIELINILRPITAVATYITFGALALHTYPEYKKRLQTEGEEYATMFAQEVRRYYPFGPFLGARVRNDFVWKGHTFQQGTLVFLDMYGTNHDEATWENPNAFIPERFKAREDDSFDFIPQGGGDDRTGTRCPGELITIELMKVSLDFLINLLDYQVPMQDLTVSMRRMPTLPKSKFIINDIIITDKKRLI